MINLIAITAVYIKYCNARLPDTIHINKSETVSLCYDVPVSATIDHQTIRLNQPIVFKQCHMGQYEMKTNLFGAIPLKKENQERRERLLEVLNTRKRIF